MHLDGFRLLGVIGALVCAALPVEAAEGWRLGEPLPEEAMVELETPVRFGEQIVAGTPHLVTLENRTLRFTDVWGMREVAGVRCRPKRFRKWQALATLETRRTGGLANPTVRLLFRYGYRSCEIMGRAEPGAQLRSARELTGKGEVIRAKVEGIPRPQSPEEVLYRALARYTPSLGDCAKSGERSKWGTDDERFIRCACPLIERWRLPGQHESRRVSVQILDFALGFSMTVTEGGRAQQCRVWAGRQPPAQEPSLLIEQVRAQRSKWDEVLP
ncbi:MAG: hypothetical protein VX834_12640 [Myxococcota bacterium]|nr:hypothetical protein [Myxococcota bacterium]